MVYGIYNELVTGDYKPTNITRGPHIAWFSHEKTPGFLPSSQCRPRQPPRRKALVSWKVKPTEAASDVEDLHHQFGMVETLWVMGNIWEIYGDLWEIYGKPQFGSWWTVEPESQIKKTNNNQQDRAGDTR